MDPVKESGMVRLKLLKDKVSMAVANNYLRTLHILDTIITYGIEKIKIA